MNYTPTVVTAANLEWAVRKNMRDAYAALLTKVHVEQVKEINGIDAGGNIIGGIAYDLTDDKSALTVEGAAALLEELT